MIAIKNVYYLLLYAWDMFDAGRMVAIDAERDTDLLNLLAGALTREVDRLLRRGLDRGYLPITDDIASIRGKVDVSATVKSNILTRARAVCQFDELSHDVVHNQILKATLHRLLWAETLDPKMRPRIRAAYRRMSGISDIRLTQRVFRSVQLHRNIRVYRFLVDVCRLLYDHLIPNESKGTFRFHDFTRDEVRMRRIFERFLYNFYKHEQIVYKVCRRRFPWAGANGSAMNLLPTMLTDVTLVRAGQCLVIEAKYSPSVFQRSPHGSPTLRSGHLYQLFAYLKNLPVSADVALDGLVIYPLANHHVDATFALPNHRLRVCTVNLNQHWKLIRNDLLSLVVPTEQ